MKKVINKIDLSFGYDPTVKEGTSRLEIAGEPPLSQILEATTKLLSHVLSALSADEDTPAAKEYNDLLAETLNAMPLAVVMGAIMSVYESASDDGTISLEPINALIRAHRSMLLEVNMVFNQSEDDEQPTVSNGNSAVAIH